MKTACVWFALAGFCLSGCGGFGTETPAAPQAKDCQSKGRTISLEEFQQVLQARCISCHFGTHDAGGPFDFNQYEKEVLTRIAKISNRLQKTDGTRMPFAGSLQDSSITQGERDIIIDWLEDCSTP